MFSVTRSLPAVLTATAVLFGLVLSAGQSSSMRVGTLTFNVPPGWTDVSPSASPPAMAGAMMAYSSRAHRFVLFGGWDGVAGLNGTWVYDPGNRTWSALHPNVSPLGRGDAMFVYDNLSDNFILFGGWHELANQTYMRLADTWVFSLETATWTERHPPVSPAPRSDSEVAYDPRVGAVLVVGGFNGTAYLGDVWSYSPGNDTWSPRPASVAPSKRADGRMVYVESQDRFLLFGGNDYSGPNAANHHLADTWAYSWSSIMWTPLTPKEGPGARDYAVFAYDPAVGLVFLATGFGDTILNDLWGFNLVSDTWVNLTPALSPPPRFAAAGGFDPVDNVLVVFSGLANTSLLADTWQYAYRPSSGASGSPPLIIVAGVSSAVVVGVAVAIVILRISRKRRLRGMP